MAVKQYYTQCDEGTSGCGSGKVGGPFDAQFGITYGGATDTVVGWQHGADGEMHAVMGDFTMDANGEWHTSNEHLLGEGELADIGTTLGTAAGAVATFVSSLVGGIKDAAQALGGALSSLVGAAPPPLTVAQAPGTFTGPEGGGIPASAAPTSQVGGQDRITTRPVQDSQGNWWRETTRIDSFGNITVSNDRMPAPPPGDLYGQGFGVDRTEGAVAQNAAYKQAYDPPTGGAVLDKQEGGVLMFSQPNDPMRAAIIADSPLVEWTPDPVAPPTQTKPTESKVPPATSGGSDGWGPSATDWQVPASSDGYDPEGAKAEHAQQVVEKGPPDAAPLPGPRVTEAQQGAPNAAGTKTPDFGTPFGGVPADPPPGGGVPLTGGQSFDKDGRWVPNVFKGALDYTWEQWGSMHGGEAAAAFLPVLAAAGALQIASWVNDIPNIPTLAFHGFEAGDQGDILGSVAALSDAAGAAGVLAEGVGVVRSLGAARGASGVRAGAYTPSRSLRDVRLLGERASARALAQASENLCAPTSMQMATGIDAAEIERVLTQYGKLDEFGAQLEDVAGAANEVAGREVVAFQQQHDVAAQVRLLTERTASGEPWVATVRSAAGDHAVVIEGLDEGGYLRVLDPDPGRFGAVGEASTVGREYRVALGDFYDMWYGEAAWSVK